MPGFSVQRVIIGICLLGVLLLAYGLYIPTKAVLAQVLMQHAWEQSQAGYKRVRPWPWADTYPLARLIIPQLKQQFIILGGSSGATLAFGPGHMTGTALPGENGHIVLSAHRDTHFSRIEALAVGHTLQLETPEGVLTEYVINQVQVIDTRYESLWIDHTENQLTLITCYPFDAVQSGGPLRFRIDAKRSQY